MSIADSVVNMFKRAFKRKAEEEVEEVVEKAVDKAVDNAVDKVVTKELRKEGITVEANGKSTETSSLKEVTNNTEGGTVNININVSSDSKAGVAASSFAASLAQANEVMSYLILDKDNNVIGVKDDAPEYIKNAYKNGEFNN